MVTQETGDIRSSTQEDRSFLRREYMLARESVQQLATASEELFKVEVTIRSQRRAAEVASLTVLRATARLRECEAEGERLQQQKMPRLCRPRSHAAQLLRSQEVLCDARRELYAALQQSRRAEYLREVEEARGDRAKAVVDIRKGCEERCHEIAARLLGSGLGMEDEAVSRAVIKVNYARRRIGEMQCRLGQEQLAVENLNKSLAYLQAVDALKTGSPSIESAGLQLLDSPPPVKIPEPDVPTFNTRRRSISRTGSSQELIMRREAARHYADAMLLSPTLPPVKRELFCKPVTVTFHAVQQAQVWQKSRAAAAELELQASRLRLTRAEERLLDEQQRIIEAL